VDFQWGNDEPVQPPSGFLVLLKCSGCGYEDTVPTSYNAIGCPDCEATMTGFEAGLLPSFRTNLDAESFSAENRCSVCGDLAVHLLKKGEIVLCDKHYQQQFGKYSAESSDSTIETYISAICDSDYDEDCLWSWGHRGGTVYDGPPFCPRCGSRIEWEVYDVNKNPDEDVISKGHTAESFNSEVFEAKPRRRTRFSWTKGKDPISPPHDRYHDTYSHEKYMRYHISGLPPGYFIHLSKHMRGWETNFKSPHSREWKHSRSSKKGLATTAAIRWYNIQVAKPEVQELTPIQQMMISKGVSKRRFSIHMTDTTIPIHGIVDGKKVLLEEIHTQRFYVMGGKANLKPFEFASIKQLGRIAGLTGVNEPRPQINFPYDEKAFDFVLPFLQGMIYLPQDTVGNIRSVNRYTKNPQVWIDSHPTWFRNMAKHKLSLHITRHKSSGVTGVTTFKINGTDFVRFHVGTAPKEGEKDYSNTHGMGEHEYYDPKESVWRTLRPTTQKNLLAKALKMGDGVKDLNRSKLTGRLFLLYVDKLNPYQPDPARGSTANWKGYVQMYDAWPMALGNNEEGFVSHTYGKFVIQGAQRMVGRYRPKE